MFRTFLIITAIYAIACADLFASCQKIELSKDLDAKAKICSDGTVTFHQPYGNSKYDDYESLCGAVAAANVFHAFCGAFISPTQISKAFFSDITPGIRPDTLESGLNELFSSYSNCAYGEWKYYYVENRWAFLDSIYYETSRNDGTWKKNPVIALISRDEGKELHWVTVTEIKGYEPGEMGVNWEECQVKYNDLGNQNWHSCKNLVKWSRAVDDKLILRWLPEYVHLVFESSISLPDVVKELLDSTEKKSRSKVTTPVSI